MASLRPFLSLLCLAMLSAAPRANAGAPEPFALTEQEAAFLESLHETPITIAYSYELVYSRRDDEHRGLLGPFVRFLEDNLGLRLVMEKTDWDTAFTRIDAGTADFYGPVVLDEARRRDFHAIEPLYRADAVLVTRTADPVRTLYALKARRIGMLEGSLVRRFLNAYIDPDTRIRSYPTMDALADALASGVVDCFVAVDGAELGLLARPELDFEIVIPNVHADEGLISGNDALTPLVNIVNRYLASAEGGVARSAMADARRQAVMDHVRRRLQAEIEWLRQHYSILHAHAAGSMYPLGFWQDGEYRGIQAEIHAVIEDLSGLRVKNLAIAEAGGLHNPRDLLRAGLCQFVTAVHTGGGFADMEGLLYSRPVWRDTLRTYALGGDSGTRRRNLRIGVTPQSGAYVDWEVLAGREPVAYASRSELLAALEKGRVDAVFASEMLFAYCQLVLRDYRFRELESLVAFGDMAMLLDRRNTELNAVVDAAVTLHRVLYPHSGAEWRARSVKTKTDYIAERESKASFYAKIAVGGVLALGVILFLLWRYARYDWQIVQLIQRQETFDLAWGNLRTGQVVSKGGFPFLRKWGFPLAGNSHGLDELGRLLGFDYRGELEAALKNMRADKVSCTVTEKAIVSPADGRLRSYRRFLHYIDDARFMLCASDITDAVVRQPLSAGSKDESGAPAILSRRAMNDLLYQKQRELSLDGGEAFLTLFRFASYHEVLCRYGAEAAESLLVRIRDLICRAADPTTTVANWGRQDIMAFLEGGNIHWAEERARAVVRAAAGIEAMEGAPSLIAGVAAFQPDVDYALSLQTVEKAAEIAMLRGAYVVHIRQGGSGRSWRYDAGDRLH